MNLQQAQAAGDHGMQISMERAIKADPLFGAKARSAILNHLYAVGEASGEDLVSIAKAHGANAPDGRSFGGIFRKLAKDGLIRCVRSDLPRARGHGTSGGKLWAAVR